MWTPSWGTLGVPVEASIGTGSKLVSMRSHTSIQGRENARCIDFRDVLGFLMRWKLEAFGTIESCGCRLPALTKDELGSSASMRRVRDTSKMMSMRNSFYSLKAQAGIAVSADSGSLNSIV